MDDPDVVECQRYRCTLPARSCAARHVKRLPSGGGRGFPRFPACAACPDGALVVERLEAEGWTRPPDTLPAEVLELAQRRARVRWVRSFPSHREPEVERLEPMRELALASPDDGGICRGPRVTCHLPVT